MRQLRIVGSAAYTRREYEAAISLVARGAVKPFYKTYRLGEVDRAYRDILEGRLGGGQCYRHKNTGWPGASYPVSVVENG